MNKIETVSFKTLGCKLNQSETDALRAKFAENNYSVKPFGEQVDLTVINTCTVTNEADRSGRHAIRQAIRNSPRGRIVVTGCYAQVNPKAIQEIEAATGCRVQTFVASTSEILTVLEQHFKVSMDASSEAEDKISRISFRSAVKQKDGSDGTLRSAMKHKESQKPKISLRSAMKDKKEEKK